MAKRNRVGAVPGDRQRVELQHQRIRVEFSGLTHDQIDLLLCHGAVVLHPVIHWNFSSSFLHGSSLIATN